MTRSSTSTCSDRSSSKKLSFISYEKGSTRSTRNRPFTIHLRRPRESMPTKTLTNSIAMPLAISSPSIGKRKGGTVMFSILFVRKWSTTNRKTGSSLKVISLRLLNSISVKTTLIPRSAKTNRINISKNKNRSK